MNAYADAMRRYFDFGGRSTRSQYWLYVLILAVIMVLATIVDGAMGNLQGQGPAFVLGIVNLLHIIPGLAVSVRRLHDINRSGWWLLIAFVPLVGTIMLLVWACMASTPGANRFGVNGRGAGKDAAVEPSLTPQSSVGPDLDRLEKLASLRASGAIDENEYQHMKSNIIGGGSLR